uniref:Uncharacterized protein n=1 Tax=Siphoviridae sp. ct13O11 TaxID=2825303 RepID=A0A8S5UD47_9CAUD|nr:MAG TPA: hypothetical protein [Siphoviridae sp. ct13O11]
MAHPPRLQPPLPRRRRNIPHIRPPSVRLPRNHAPRPQRHLPSLPRLAKTRVVRAHGSHLPARRRPLAQLRPHGRPHNHTPTPHTHHTHYTHQHTLPPNSHHQPSHTPHVRTPQQLTRTTPTQRALFPPEQHKYHLLLL